MGDGLDRLMPMRILLNSTYRAVFWPPPKQNQVALENRRTTSASMIVCPKLQSAFFITRMVLEAQLSCCTSMIVVVRKAIQKPVCLQSQGVVDQVKFLARHYSSGIQKLCPPTDSHAGDTTL